MPFVPGTTVRLLAGVDLHRDLSNTMDWDTQAEQTAFFVSKTAGGLVSTDFTYQRENGQIRFPANVEALHEVNYLMFQNTNYSSKWYYGFIDSVEYQSPASSLVKFTLDPWQTYFFDLDWKTCLIEREHVTNDAIGAHIIPENLDVGDLVVNEEDDVDGLNYPLIVFASSHDPYLDAPVSAQSYSNMYSPVGYFAFYMSSVSKINNFIGLLVSQSSLSALAGAFSYPEAMLTGFTEEQMIPSTTAYSITKYFTPNESTLDGYNPRNNKLFTYPFNMLSVFHMNGGQAIYSIEQFPNNDPVFSITGDIGPNPTIYCSPFGYKDTTSSNRAESLPMTQYPLAAYSYDAFKEYLARNIVTAPLSLAASGLSLLGGIASKNPMAIGGGVVGLAETIGGFYEKSLLPMQTKGQMSGAGAIAVYGQTFIIQQKCVNAKHAAMLDSYFDMYGYKTARLAVPAVRTRPKWNYLKLHEANVFGSFPNQELERIRESLLKGVTFWHGDWVGDYSLNNT
jgi:hypothetical protein